MDKIIDKVHRKDDCQVFLPTGQPQNLAHDLPQDLIDFYNICGGLSLYVDHFRAFHILKPTDFTLTNPVIVGDLCDYDISCNWYLIGIDDNGDYISIDLAPERLGRCYNSAWDHHGVQGSCDIIANSFTELLQNLIKFKGNYWYTAKFKPIGDAYDEHDQE